MYTKQKRNIWLHRAVSYLFSTSMGFGIFFLYFFYFFKNKNNILFSHACVESLKKGNVEI